MIQTLTAKFIPSRKRGEKGNRKGKNQPFGQRNFPYEKFPHLAGDPTLRRYAKQEHYQLS